MAKVSFSSLIADITGKLGGSVFQNSQSGFQIRTRVSPRNPQSSHQQYNRGYFSKISGSWRSLSGTDMSTFIDNAPIGVSGIDLYIGANINLNTAGQPLITTYIPATFPDPFPIMVTSCEPTSFTIQAAGTPTTIPAGQTLLLSATASYQRSRTFINDSDFAIITQIPTGTDLSTDYTIQVAYLARWKQKIIGTKISLSSSLVDNANGNRSPESVYTTQVTV